MEVNRLYTKNTLRNYDYILTFDNGQVGIVDPSDKNLLMSHLEALDFIFITHEHYDHIVGVEEFIEKYNPKVYCPISIGGRFQNTHTLREGDIVELSATEDFEIIFIPGHYPSHLGFLYRKNQKREAAFLGDTIFNGGVGNVRDGDVNILAQTLLTKISSLEDDLILYPEHDYWESNLNFSLSIVPENEFAQKKLAAYKNTNAINDGDFPAATLGEERTYNLFLQAKTKDRVIELRNKRDNW